MIPIPIATQAYTSRSLPLNAQRLVNMYPEQAPPGSKAPFALFPTPGLTTLVTVGSGPIRGSIVMGSLLYVVSGSTFYSVDTSWTATEIGSIEPTQRVSMAHNGTQILIACGSNGYIYSVSGGLEAISDEDYPGADQVDFIDGFFIVTQDGESTFWKSGSYDGTSWAGDDFATAEGDPDNIVGQIVDHREIWLFGSRTTEVWWNEGVDAFPFSRLQNAFIERGCAARFSVAKLVNTVFWLGDDRVVYLAEAYNPQRISTHAIEQAIQGYSTISDAFAYAYTDEGHKFYVLTFPTESVTWCYDMATQAWHERQHYAYDKVNQKFGIRHRSNNYSRFNEAHVVGDYSNGNLYKLDSSSYTDGSGSTTTEKIINGDLASGDTGWTLTGSANTTSFSIFALAAGMSQPYLYFGQQPGTAKQDSVFTAGNTYTLTVTGVMFAGTISIYNGSSKDELIGTISNTTTVNYSFEFTAGSSDGALYFEKGFSGDGSSGAVDDISVIEAGSTATKIQRVFSSGVIQNQEQWSFMAALQVVFESGTGLITGQGSDPQVMMQYSDDGGRTWSNEAWRGIGSIGKYEHRSIWRRLGKFRSRIFRWVVSDPVNVVVLTAYGE